ncbi:Sec-independent protein translocase protein TatB [Thioalkalivibrio sp. HK1]|uniref:Sec-independent protein translocase protein TatB n=1 Tax=Thioalkalivibrio sp. HK1 TaxID=1469245 RepID=UPI000472F0BE|nr:Sec-independent protein translocase protein TatB [Thioalkalivibrio sp. HK1]
MFDIGFLEIALISIIALLVVGPERLPKMVRTIGLWMGRIRRYINQAKNDIDREVRLQEWKEQLAKPASEFTQIREAANETKEVFEEAKSAIESVDSPASSSAQVPKNAPSIAPDRPENASKDEKKPDEPATGSGSSSKLASKKEDSSGDPQVPTAADDAPAFAARSADEGQSDSFGASADGTNVGGSNGDISPPGADPVVSSKEKPAPEAARSASETPR